jgi:mono/diheme cytochrome c family protein
VPPLGIVLEDPQRIRALADRIMVRAVITKTMPLGNLTGMTDEERKDLGSWIAHGADLGGDAALLTTEPTATPSPPDAGGAAAPPPTLPALAPKPKRPPEDVAAQIYGERCILCHGKEGRGDGTTAAALDPKPRNFADHAWQVATPDDELRKVIATGGAANGKSPLMPPNTDVASDPEVLEAMVKRVRSFDSAAAPKK